MKDKSTTGWPAAGATDTPGMPVVVDRAAFQAELDALRIREKAHTREGDAIAAARRRLPMVEVDASLALIGPHGPLTLLEAFEGRRQLIAYYFMWHPGRPAAEQCEGCTWVTTQVTELSYLHSRDITYAVFCQGPYAKAPATATSWAGTCRGTQHSPPSTRSSSGARSAGCTLCATYGTVTASSKRTGRPSAASRQWITATRSWTSPYTDARSRGRIRPLAGHNGAPSRGPTAARPLGHQCQCGRADAPSPSGRDSKLDALTTSALPGAERIPALLGSRPKRSARAVGNEHRRHPRRSKLVRVSWRDRSRRRPPPHSASRRSTRAGALRRRRRFASWIASALLPGIDERTAALWDGRTPDGGTWSVAADGSPSHPARCSRSTTLPDPRGRVRPASLQPSG
jgi:Bacterial protein of unknown function (DUF899)